MAKQCHIEAFTDEKESLRSVLDAVCAAGVLAGQKRILIKPNLINTSHPPITRRAAIGKKRFSTGTCTGQFSN